MSALGWARSVLSVPHDSTANQISSAAISLLSAPVPSPPSTVAAAGDAP